MTFTADLHLHSKYSRAVSQAMVLPEMARWARLKGLDIISASDFTHPLWFRELKNQLKETSEGLYQLKSTDHGLQTTAKTNAVDDSRKSVSFLLTTELASIYKQGDKLRRIHNLVFAPSLETVEKINKEFTRRAFNLMADGRPIFGLSSENLLELLLSIDENIFLIPCHVWTPHFGVYGSKSGFDSLDEAFGEFSKYVYGIETGISSDPEMNWRMKELTDRSILSFSDAHSAANMGREATAFELEKPTYQNLKTAVMRIQGIKNKVAYTIEFYPEEGKYHYSGHRNCNTSFTPSEIKEKGSVCPVCKREFTEGVAVRIEQLAGGEFVKEYEEKISDSGIKWYADKSRNHPPYVKLVRLEQIIGAGLAMTSTSAKVKTLASEMCREFDSELNALLKTPLADISKFAGEKVAEALGKVRRGEIEVEPGFDGEYGKVKIFKEKEEVTQEKAEDEKSQLGLTF